MVAECIVKGMCTEFPEAEFVLHPMADGGEGTVNAILSTTVGRKVSLIAHDPLMREIECQFGIIDDGKTAIIEMASASGLERLNKDERNPWMTTTYGTGEIIKAALDRGCRNIILGIGGSATNDIGTGMANALGVRFLDSRKNPVQMGGGFLDEIKVIDMSGLDPRISHTHIRVATDVNNPLYGPNGAAMVYAAQKGADVEMVRQLDEKVNSFAVVLMKYFGKDFSQVPGSGAAGGLGAGLIAFTNAELVNGFDLLAQITHLEDRIKSSGLVITGEGKVDRQTGFGKTAFGVAQLAKKYQKPVIVIGGALDDGCEELYGKGVSALVPIADKPLSPEYSILHAPELLQNAANRIARLIRIGKSL